ncbi:MAG: hypothetical protein C4310_14545, partial [Chloroflexota bacterium]
MSQPPRGGSATLVLSIIALIVSFASLGYGLSVISGLQSSITSLQGTVSTQQGDINALKQALGTLPIVNQRPITRAITLTWFTDASGQDRFDPPIIIVNQGDIVRVTFISNDTADGHTFEFNLPNGTTWVRLNVSVAGQENFLNGQKFTGPPTGCIQDGRPIACDTTGTIGNLTAVGTFTTSGLQPGIYRFFCLYHQGIGMFGFLLIVPNKGAGGG